MTNTSSLLTTALGLLTICATVPVQGAPKIQFEQTIYDFGKTSQVATVSGIFKFKNLGDAVLNLEAPKPSCGCTAAEVKPNTLPPGTAGEIPFTLNLGFYRGNIEKHISVRSNDPLTPEVSLTIRVDYTPLFELTPMTLSPNLAYGMNETNQFTSLVRTDGKPLQIVRLEGSQSWITAAVEPGGPQNETNAHIRVTIKRDGSPRHFNEYVRVYTADQSNAPASSLYLYGEVMGEVSLTPEALYWSITAGANAAPPITQHVVIRAADGQPLEIKNPQSSIKGITMELLPKENGKAYELIARLDDVPASTVSGKVTFDTSVAAQPRMEVPVIVNVFKP